MKYFVANWKEHKNLKEALTWAKEFGALLKKDSKILRKLNGDEIKIIVCPPFPLLIPFKNELFQNENIHVGAQNVSHFEGGSYTGEVSAKTLAGIVGYSIIGHSERRQYFSESDEDIAKKVAHATEYNITPIVCVRNTKDIIPDNVTIVAYEPPEYIGTGKTQALDAILEMRDTLKLKSNQIFLYGAGVTEDSVKEYLSTSQIDGLLIGSASLDPKRFYDIVSRI